MSDADDAGTTPVVPYRWIVPACLSLRYANAFSVHHSQHEFYLRFFEAVPPPDPYAAPPESLDATCVAQFALSPGRLKELRDLLDEQLREMHGEQQ